MDLADRIFESAEFYLLSLGGFFVSCPVATVHAAFASFSSLRSYNHPLFSAPLPFRSRNHRFLIIPPPCAIVSAGQSATKPTLALPARDIRQYPNERSNRETASKGTRMGKDVPKVEK